VQGADGVEIWNFKAVKKGVDTLKFVYAKPWEKSTQSTQTKSIIVQVK